MFAEVGVVRLTCNCIACAVLSVAAVLLLALSLHGYWRLGWNALTWTSVILIPVLVFGCGFVCRRRECKRLAELRPDQDDKGEE